MAHSSLLQLVLKRNHLVKLKYYLSYPNRKTLPLSICIHTVSVEFFRRVNETRVCRGTTLLVRGSTSYFRFTIPCFQRYLDSPRMRHKDLALRRTEQFEQSWHHLWTPWQRRTRDLNYISKNNSGFGYHIPNRHDGIIKCRNGCHNGRDPVSRLIHISSYLIRPFRNVFIRKQTINKVFNDLGNRLCFFPFRSWIGTVVEHVTKMNDSSMLQRLNWEKSGNVFNLASKQTTWMVYQHVNKLFLIVSSRNIIFYDSLNQRDGSFHISSLRALK